MANQLPPNQAWLLFHPQRDNDYRFFEDASAAHPFEPNAATYSPTNAAWLADAALLAYWDGSARQKYPAAGLVQYDYLDAGSMQCHVAQYDRFAIVAFRGTQPNQFKDVLFDAAFLPTAWDQTASVHAGFRAALDQLWPSLSALLQAATAAGRAVWFTGHSLGAALAVLAAARFASSAGVYTFGCPRVGDDAFAAAFDQRFGGRSFRFVNALDIVATVPPEPPVHLHLGGLLRTHDYRHVPTGRQIAADGTIRDGEVSAGFAELFHRFGGQVVQDLIALRSGRLFQDFEQLPPYLSDHMPRAYAVHVWNDLRRSS